MESLFLIDYTAHFGLAVAGITGFVQDTNAPYFELEDDANLELMVYYTRSAGIAKFNNTKRLQMALVNYDKFLTSLPEAFKEGKKRCDVLLCSDSKDYFILGELKDRTYKRPVRLSAKKQLLNSLETILQVDAIKQVVDSKSTRRCCYFNKQGKAPNILSATTAFNRLNRSYPSGFQMLYPAVEKLGFEFYEYSGEQTVAL